MNIKMKIKKFISIILSVVFLLSFMFLITSAHPGRTDGNGGHYDRDTGKYHYHHGYPAHQHTNGICPYDYDDAVTDKKSKNNNKYDWIIYLVSIFIVLSIHIFIPMFLLDRKNKTKSKNKSKGKSNKKLNKVLSNKKSSTITVTEIDSDDNISGKKYIEKSKNNVINSKIAIQDPIIEISEQLNNFSFPIMNEYLVKESDNKHITFYEMLYIKTIEFENILIKLENIRKTNKLIVTDITISYKELINKCKQNSKQFLLSIPIYNDFIGYCEEFITYLYHDNSKQILNSELDILSWEIIRLVSENMLYSNKFYYDVGMLDSDGNQLYNIVIKSYNQLYNFGIFTLSQLQNNINDIVKLIRSNGIYTYKP
ncbi:MAG: YHYH domain-containing protein [Acutalibacteraceae bacterium]